MNSVKNFNETTNDKFDQQSIVLNLTNQLTV